MSPEAAERARIKRREYYLANRDKVIARAVKWNKENKGKSGASVKRWQQANRAAVNRSSRRHWLKKNYGLTIEQKQEMIASQGGLCAICKTDDPGKRGWQVDHCHASGILREVLCNRCNLLLGHARDDREILERAIEYLTRNQSK